MHHAGLSVALPCRNDDGDSMTRLFRSTTAAPDVGGDDAPDGRTDGLVGQAAPRCRMFSCSDFPSRPSNEGVDLFATMQSNFYPDGTNDFIPHSMRSRSEAQSSQLTAPRTVAVPDLP